MGGKDSGRDPYDADAGTSVGFPDASSATTCELSSDLTFGYGGSLVATTTTFKLASAGVLTITKSSSGAPDKICKLTLAACGSAAEIDVSDIARDLANPDVQAVLDATTPPYFGIPSGDASSFDVFDSGGRGFSYGANQDLCTPQRVPPCSAAPAGVVHLVDDLMQLEAAGYAACPG